MWSQLYVNSHVILISSYFLLPTKLITKLLQTICCCHPHLFYTNLDITYSCIDLDTISHTSALVFSRKKVLHVLQSWNQAACLIAGLRKKIIYRSAHFPFGGSGVGDVIQKKATERAINKVVRETAG